MPENIALACLIIDCSEQPQEVPQETPARNHNDLNLALRCLRQLQPQTPILTHLSHRLDRWLMQQADALPQSVVVAYDDLKIVPAQENEPGA